MKGMEQRLAALRAAIPEVEPQEAKSLVDAGALLVDVREADEIANGSPYGSLRIGRGFLELRIEDAVQDKSRTLVTMCAGGVRSLFAADALRNLGYSDVRSIAGGFNRWKNQGLTFEIPRVLSAEAKERYSRHLLLPEVGEAGQLKLLGSKVLLIGAGGLGSPTAFYLAAAGVGTLGLVDHDVVDRSNLQRQIIHTEARVGMPKVASASESIEALNPDVKVNTYQTRLDASNVEEIFADYDVIVDGTDNLPTRYLVNDACVKLGKPLVHAAVYRFEGQVTVFWPSHPDNPSGCYRCMFPKRPDPSDAPSCSEIGVMGAVVGVVGLLQSVEVLKVLLGMGQPLVGRMLYYDALRSTFSEFKVNRRKDCRLCGEGAEFPGYDEFEQVCAAPSK